MRWDSNQPLNPFLYQSAFIHSTFYYLQIQIHRPFIHRTTSLSFPSLAICTNAARTCSHLLDAKGPGWMYPYPNIFVEWAFLLPSSKCLIRVFLNRFLLMLQVLCYYCTCMAVVERVSKRTLRKR